MKGEDEERQQQQQQEIKIKPKPKQNTYTHDTNMYERKIRNVYKKKSNGIQIW